MDVRAMGTFRRFEVAERIDLKTEEILKRLEKNRFLPLEKAVEETERFGWITVEHLFDTRFEAEKVFRDPYAVFALRIDRRRIPANLVKAHLKIAEIAHVNATGKKVGPAKRRELREEVRRQLIEKTLPVAASVQVVWNVASGEVWFGNTSDKACEAFLRQFEDTFDTTLIPQTPRHVALRALSGEAGGVDRAAVTTFSKEEPKYRLVAAG